MNQDETWVAEMVVEGDSQAPAEELITVVVLVLEEVVITVVDLEEVITVGDMKADRRGDLADQEVSLTICAHTLVIFLH
jgi:hypothetical protein